MMINSIDYAELAWQQGDPVSKQFDDVYYSLLSGLAESRVVFIEQNDLVARWAACADAFTIAETGFGTGLNFLLTWQLWRECYAWQNIEKNISKNNVLTFISVDKYPLHFNDLRYALNQWPTLTRYAEELFVKYPSLTVGENYFEFDQGQVRLLLYIGDINIWLSLLNHRINAWFLDGFAPSKNPEMWSMPLFTAMAQLTHKNGSFATFTSAGFVRRALIQAGFVVKKTPGFAGKREMMRGWKKI
ncbi:tRNA (5-methylaminomethyl-2-thiouridine)(34)-methyltransferase MnmD [Piscirickettsia salmonis]|uniref:tRNA (5-methylaminomethyl-2-thiouridine)(34)-methyltransferase MnmD n=1 Tax=Piscirickettsia salmonis TaxID=1238 RepID=UPI0007C8E1FE|nr:tRNA 5-methylaminomethyl-2-thiouridine biosynthesis bifunctional protein MnmC [Piscirickettsiaceae bacterium NZ-RLO1]